MNRIMQEKLCTSCGETKRLSDFNASKSGAVKSICRKCVSERNRWGHLRRRYKITPEMWTAMVVEQGGLCKLCRENPPQVVDHDHACCDTGDTSKYTCGKCVRGLLCTRCNHFLHGIEAGLLEKALDYLR